MKDPRLPRDPENRSVSVFTPAPFAPIPQGDSRHASYEPRAWNSEGDVHLRDYLRVLRRRRGWVFGVFLVLVGVVGWFTYRQTPIFEASTTIRIEAPESETPILSELAALQKQSPIVTEIQMLKSRSLVEDVVRDLGLNVQVLEARRLSHRADPRSAYRWLMAAGSSPRRSDLIDTVSVSGGVRPGRYLVQYDTGFWTARQGRQVLARAPAGQPLELGGLRVIPRDVSRPEGLALTLDVTRLRDAVDACLAKLSVVAPVRDASMVRVTYRDSDPELARAAVNAIASKFIARSSLANKSSARSTREFIESQLAQLSWELRRREEELRSYKQEAQVVALSREADLGIESFARFEAEREQYVAERNALVSLMEAAASGRNDSDLSIFPSFIENEAVQQLKAQENALESEKSKLLTEKTPAHPDVLAVEEQIEQVRAGLDRAARGYRSALDSKIKALDQTLRGSRGELERMPEKEVNLARLLRAQKVTEELYTQLQMKLQEAKLAEAVELASIRVIDPAVLPESPISPNKALNLAMAMIVGLLLGCGTAFIKEYFDDTVRTKEHIERDLRLSILGSIPLIGRNGQKALPTTASVRRPGDGGPGSAEPKPRPRRPRKGAPTLLTDLAPFSAAAEAYRAIRTNLSMLPKREERDGAARRVLITSPGPRDGKTVTAVNLAISFAQQGTRTLLVDADLRKGLVHAHLDMPRRKGLADYLSGHAELGEVVRLTAVENLFAITTGSASPFPAELLGSSRMDRLLTVLGQQVAVLILDSPPVLPVADAVSLSRKVDDVLLVVRSGFTNSSAAAETLDLLAGPHSPRVACILNGLDLKLAYGNAYYGQYYQPYYLDQLGKAVCEGASDEDAERAAEPEPPGEGGQPRTAAAEEHGTDGPALGGEVERSSTA